MRSWITNASSLLSIRSTRARITLGLFFLALAVRLFYLYESSDNPTFDQPIVDAGAYNELARSLAEGTPMSERFFWQPFFYPAFLSLLHALSESSIAFARVIQLLLGALTCVLTYRLGELVFDRRTGVLAAIMTALYGPLIFFEAELLATGWAAFWSVVLILLVLRIRATRGLRLCFLLGMCGALSVLTRPTFLPFFVVTCLWLGIALGRASAGRRLPIRSLLAAVGGFVLVALPVAIQKYRVTGRFGILPASGGINLYIGNNPEPCETLTIRPGSEWLRFRKRAGQLGESGPAAADRFFYEQTREYVSTQPLDFLGGLVRKTLQFISSREIPRNVDIYLFARWSRLLGLLTWKVGPLGFPFGILLPLAVLGVVFRAREVPVPVYLFLLCYPLSIILVFVAARYRLPVIPLMSILAAAGCFAAINIIRKRDWRRMGVSAGCCIVVLLLSTLPGPFCEEQMDLEAEMYRGLGWNYFRSGRLDEAIANTSHALQLEPESATAHNNLGLFLRQKGSLERAAAHFVEALRIEPDHANGHANLGGVWLLQGRLAPAGVQFSEALRFEPDNPNTHVLLASVLRRQGRYDEAALHYDVAQQLDSNLAQARKGLAATRARLGKIKQAVKEYREALELNPERTNVRFLLAAALEQTGELEAAIAEYDHVLRSDPENKHAQQRLDAASARLAVRSEARTIVDTLWEQLNDAGLVAQRLRDDDALSAPVRRAALDLVLRRTARDSEKLP